MASGRRRREPRPTPGVSRRSFLKGAAGQVPSRQVSSPSLTWRSAARTASRSRTPSPARRPRTGTATARPRSRGSPPSSASLPGATVAFKIQDGVDQLPRPHLPARLVRRPRRPAHRRPHAHRCRCPRTSRRRSRTPATGLDRLRQLGHLGDLDRCRRTASRASTTRCSSASTATAQRNHTLFVVRRTGPSDILVQTSEATWQAYNVWGGRCLYPWVQERGVQGQLQPTGDPVLPGDRLLLDGVAARPLARAQRLRRRRTAATSTPIATRRTCSTARCSSPSGHDEYWSGADARQRRGGS